jgi:hypothetical protein
LDLDADESLQGQVLRWINPGISKPMKMSQVVIPGNQRYNRP